MQSQPMNHGSQTIQQQGRIIEIRPQEGIVTGEHGQGEGWKMAKKPCKHDGDIWRNKKGACPTCAEIRKSKTRTPKTQRVLNWFPCSCCLAKIGYGSKITAKLLGVTPSTVNERWVKAGIERYVPVGRNWELHRRQKRNKSNIIRIPLPITLAERKRRRFKGIIQTIKRGGSRSVSSLTGCTANQLKRHLESAFKRGMTWDNHGTYWHIDHILPVASFDHSDPKQVAQCWHWTNLRPLEAKANISKGDRITNPQMQLLLCATH
jgi:hypothetical protein